MTTRVDPSPTKAEEVINVLNAISIVSERLAKRLQAYTRPRQSRCPQHTCHLRQERMKNHEVVRG